MYYFVGKLHGSGTFFTSKAKTAKGLLRQAHRYGSGHVYRAVHDGMFTRVMDWCPICFDMDGNYFY